jgi:hypothetical protein
MPLKSGILDKFSLRQVLAIIIVSASIWWASADTLAQETAPAGLAHLSSASHPIDRPIGPISSLSLTEKEASGPIVLSRLYAPAPSIDGGRDFHAERTIRGETLLSSLQHPEAKGYSLLHEGSASGFFLYGDQMSHFLATQSLANRESSTHEVKDAPLPLVQLKFGGLEIPIRLADAASSR